MYRLSRWVFFLCGLRGILFIISLFRHRQSSKHPKLTQDRRRREGRKGGGGVPSPLFVFDHPKGRCTAVCTFLHVPTGVDNPSARNVHILYDGYPCGVSKRHVKNFLYDRPDFVSEEGSVSPRHHCASSCHKSKRNAFYGGLTDHPEWTSSPFPLFFLLFVVVPPLHPARSNLPFLRFLSSPSPRRNLYRPSFPVREKEGKRKGIDKPTAGGEASAGRREGGRGLRGGTKRGFIPLIPPPPPPHANPPFRKKPSLDDSRPHISEGARAGGAEDGADPHLATEQTRSSQFVALHLLDPTATSATISASHPLNPHVLLRPFRA